MSTTLTIPFFSFRLHFVSGGSVSMPLQKPSAVRMKQSIQEISKLYAKEFQKHIVDEGKYEQILEEWQDGDFFKSQIRVAFPAAKNGFSFPSFELDFDFFYKKTEKGYWLIIPSLALEAFVEEESQLEQTLAAAVRLEFERKKRLSAVQRIVATIWYDEVELLRDDISLKIHTPTELQKVEESQKEAWLPQVATLLEVKEQTTYGRKEEMERLARAFNGSFSRNILLVGVSGVGKTALIRELSFRKKQYNYTGRIWETTASVLIKELIQDTGWQDNIAHVIKELTVSGDILFVRNLLELFEVGKYEGNSISIAEYLLTYISRGELNIISECTEEEKSIIELRSPSFLTNFQIIPLVEPQKKLEEIILKKMQNLAKKHKAKIDTEAIKETIRLNKRFTPYSGFPGKPIRFLESILLDQMDKAVKEVNLKVSRSEVIRYFCEETGMPIFMVDPEIPMRPKRVKTDFNNSVFGQTRAVDGVISMLSAVKTGLSKIGKPISSFLFVGPTGVGKTELAKVLAEFMFGDRDKMVRFDMSEYSSYDAVSKLLGQGYYSDGLLTSTIRREPFCVLLFDEIEKAHPDFFDLLLQMLSEGRLTDSQGKLVNFCSTIIIMTSNIGAVNMQRRKIGPENKNKNKELAGRYLKAVQDYFKPELYNRIDQVISFDPLSKETVRYVVEREIEQLKKREGIRYRRMDLEIQDEVLDYLAEEGYDSRYGARYLQRALREKLVIPLSRQLNLVDADDQLVVKVSMENKKVEIKVDVDPLGIDLLFEEIEKNDYADLAGNYRRDINEFQDGYLFTQVMSDLDILVREKKSLKEKFWEEATRVNRYTRLLDLKDDAQKKAEIIEKLEINYALACMNLQTYQTEWSQELEGWKDIFFDLKVKTLLLSDEKYRHCHLRIYGKKMEQLIHFYKKILEHKEYDVALKTIWYREDFFYEEVKVENKKGKVGFQAREEYCFRNWEENSEDNLIPEEKDDQFCGVDFLIKGNCPSVYLQNEVGMQHWEISKDEEYDYIVEVVNMNTPFSKILHKKSFFESQKPFRFLSSSSMEDKNLKIKRQINIKNYLDFMISTLEEQFKLNVDLAVK